MKIAKFSEKYDTPFEYTKSGDVIESGSGRLYLVSKPNSSMVDKHNTINLSSGAKVCFNSYTSVCVHKNATLHLKNPGLEEDGDEFDPSEEVVY